MVGGDKASEGSEMRRECAVIVGVAAFFALPACVSAPHDAELACETGAITLDGDFEAAGFAACHREGPSSFRLSITPENAPPINCSPWYAFRLRQNDPARPAIVKIKLDYQACSHRYGPKISADGNNWKALPIDAVTAISDDMKHVDVSLILDRPQLFVAAQEILASDFFDRLFERHASQAGVAQFILGTSRAGRPVRAMNVHDGEEPAREQVLLIGRQHPPEVTGALAMDPFIEAVLGNDPIARAYRARFETIVIPLLNPDGVANGYWRHNLGGKDLNRDWGKYSEPETAAVSRLIEAIDRDPNRRLRLMIDFHSTRSNLVYTIPDDLPTNPPLVLRDWLDRLSARMPGHKVNRISEHEPGLPTAKTYMYERYGFPTATFEVGDNTDRQLIARLGREAALAMMAAMLDTKPPAVK